MSINIWSPQGQLTGLTGKSNPTVIYEGNPQILAGNVFKMWVGANNNAAGLFYYESLDGVTSWTPHPSNPIVALTSGQTFPTVSKIGSTYYLYSGYTAVNVRTSSDGITFGAPTTIINLGAGGSWDDTHVAQLNIVPGTPGFGTNTGETYYGYYQGIISTGGSGLGLVTTTNLAAGPYTKSGSNPIMTFTSPGAFQKIGSTYYFWGPHGAVPASLSSQTLGYNCLTRRSAPAPDGPWTELNFNGQPVGVIYASIRADLDVAGTNTNIKGANVSDPTMLSANGNMYIYWGRTTTGGIQSGINAAVATNVTPAQQVSGYEGMVGFPIPNTTNPPLNLNILGTDAFQRADANPIGGNWTTLAIQANYVDAQLVSHFAETTAVGNNGASYWNAAAFPNDQWSQTTVQTNNASFVGSNVRMNTAGAATMYQNYWHNATALGAAGSALIIRVTAGTAVAIATLSTLTMNIGDTLLLAVSGSNLLLYYNGYPIVAATDANFASGASGFTVQAATTVANGQISAWSGGGMVSAGNPFATASSWTQQQMFHRRRD